MIPDSFGLFFSLFVHYLVGDNHSVHSLHIVNLNTLENLTNITKFNNYIIAICTYKASRKAKFLPFLLLVGIAIVPCSTILYLKK